VPGIRSPSCFRRSTCARPVVGSDLGKRDRIGTSLSPWLSLRLRGRMGPDYRRRTPVVTRSGAGSRDGWSERVTAYPVDGRCL